MINPELKRQILELESEGFEVKEKQRSPYNHVYLEKDNWFFIFRMIPTWEDNGNGLPVRSSKSKLYLSVLAKDPTKTEIDVDNHLPRYYGPCKTIDDFRTILKLLEI